MQLGFFTAFFCALRFVVLRSVRVLLFLRVVATRAYSLNRLRPCSRALLCADMSVIGPVYRGIGMLVIMAWLWGQSPENAFACSHFVALLSMQCFVLLAVLNLFASSVSRFRTMQALLCTCGRTSASTTSSSSSSTRAIVSRTGKSLTKSAGHNRLH